MDIDGTLVNDQKKVTPATRQVIEQLQAQGHLFYIASGRMYVLATAIAHLVNDQVHVIASNGAVYETKDGLQVAHLGRKAVLAAYDAAERAHLTGHFFTLDTAYDNRNTYSVAALRAANIDRNNTNLKTIQIQSRAQIERVADKIINGIISDYKKQIQLKVTHAYLGRQHLMNLSSSNRGNIELIPSHYDKAVAVQAIQKLSGIPAERTIVFGDGMNDTGMMQVADISVAMGNAQPRVKKFAHYETTTNNENGVAVFLKKYFKL
ncbi:hypothetical protein IV40_GL001746 [Lactobacillus selangorensis]|nr:hypothetical protein IV40_GL001746 [Lactobacillus selangorensis]